MYAQELAELARLIKAGNTADALKFIAEIAYYNDMADGELYKLCIEAGVIDEEAKRQKRDGYLRDIARAYYS